MIKIENLSFSFPQKNLFEKITFTLEEGQHCAFIGTSGSGKSTLIDILMDPEKYLYDGTYSKDPLCRIGYISQFLDADAAQSTTVFEYIAKDFIALQREIAEICVKMETSNDIEPLLDQYQIALDTFAAMGGDDFESEINKKLSLADLTGHKGLSVKDLSGGEFKLVQVIKEMLTQPDLLIMDEPDAYLDFENLSALKNLLKAFKGMLLVVTHNRFLLNHCFNKIIHLENTELQEFDGTYTLYNFSLLQKKIELQELSIADELEIERNEKIVGQLRFIASYNTEASRGKALKARVKIHERLVARKIKAPFVKIKQPNIQFPKVIATEPETLLTVSNYSLAFDKVLLKDVQFEIKSNDKIAIIGSNGTGKTTLLRQIYSGDHPAITLSPNARVAYLSQVQSEMLNEKNSILDEFYDAGLPSSSSIISHLSAYGFGEETLSQKIGSLSGGEKNILQFAKIALLDANLLLLDEPTSHLDTYSQLALEKAISSFEGAVLMISHDYYTIANSMDACFIIEDETLRNLTLKKFKRMIYANHFDKHYLEFEASKKQIEIDIEMALKDQDFETAKVHSEALALLIEKHHA